MGALGGRRRGESSHVYLNVPCNHFRKIKLDIDQQMGCNIDISSSHGNMAYIYCFFNCWPHILSASCPVGLVSVSLVSCLSHVCRLHVCWPCIWPR